MIGDTATGVRLTGSIAGQRADILLSGGGIHPSGYLYLVPGTDTLVVGLRDPSGDWDEFFTMWRPAQGRAPRKREG
ncbi:MAG: hypothetical protein MUE60_08270 [Candidatus Eisenbacteria bacterium]|nr:hypothetical protein [Candidatus Eisenbacteria bacterium]